MISTNEKTGAGCSPFRSQTHHQNASFDTKRISRKPFGIKGQRARYWLKITAAQRYNELGRLIEYRHMHGLDMGPASGWALVLANLCECLGVTSDCQTVGELCRRLRLPAIDPDIIAPACMPAEGRLLDQAYVGALVEVTACERQDLRLLRIEAYDECAADRRRRLDRERKRRVRRTYTGEKVCNADNRRRTASPALRALRSTSSLRLPLPQEPHRLWGSFSEKEKSRAAQQQAGPTEGRAARSAAEGAYAAPQAQRTELGEVRRDGRSPSSDKARPVLSVQGRAMEGRDGRLALRDPEKRARRQRGSHPRLDGCEGSGPVSDGSKHPTRHG